jgi:hypothetical protein
MLVGDGTRVSVSFGSVGETTGEGVNNIPGDGDSVSVGVAVEAADGIAE